MFVNCGKDHGGKAGSCVSLKVNGRTYLTRKSHMIIKLKTFMCDKTNPGEFNTVSLGHNLVIKDHSINPKTNKILETVEMKKDTD
jgi:hypothetical protein